ncbi:hypothetical protein [Spirillospora sp. CA-294931]|uniref:hypothetical protein n=1 Tax=Spirillospora sp. CA-294931 TaxID=3240042 RepID=UPI003D8F3D69
MEADPGGRRRPRARTAALLALGSAACLLTVLGVRAAGPDGDAPAAKVPAAVTAPAEKAVTAVLANRARAVREHDRTAFLATVAAAPAAFQDAQARMYDNLARLPLDGWRETYRGAAPGAGSASVRVTLEYRLEGFDRSPVTRERTLTFAPRSDTWVITGERPGDTEIWDGGPLTVVRGKSSLVIGDASGLAEVARHLDAAVPVVSEVVGKAWARRAVALVPADPARAAELAGGGRDLQEIAALATASPDRIVIAPGTFGRLNRLGRDVVLTHELTHVATGGARDGRTPLWLIEGFADYVGYREAKVGVGSAARELAREVRAGRVPSALPGAESFDHPSGRLSQAYQEAWLACRMIADRYGESTLVRLYRAAGQRSEAAALDDVLGLTPARLTAMWRDYLQEELR